MIAQIGAIVLAAGGSSRLGRPKQLLEIGGKSLVRRAVDEAFAAGFSPIVVVLGSSGSAIASQLQDAPCVMVMNENWSDGIGSSLSAGMRELLKSDADRAVLMVCDQPGVDAAVLKRLVSEQETTGAPIVACAYDGTLGVPTLFDRECFAELSQLNGDQGAKKIILGYGDRVASVDFPQGAMDIDTLDDLKALER